MPKKGENIYKRKDGRWEGRYIVSYTPEHKAKYAYVYGRTYGEVMWIAFFQIKYGLCCESVKS